MFFLVAKLTLNFGLEPSKHTKVAILFANSFPIVFNVALVSNITLAFNLTLHILFLFFFFFWKGNGMELNHNKESYRDNLQNRIEAQITNISARNKRSYTRGRDSNPEVLGSNSSSEMSKLMSNGVEVSA